MATTYKVKYWAETQNYREQLYRIEVQRRTTGSVGVVKKMGDLCALDLEVQGATDDVTAAIVKTQLRFSVVDTPDIPDTTTVKHGSWQELFTPDDTLYKVVLYSDQNGSWAPRWAGYITPDSWSENLDYHTPITIVARDNIGHLQDFPFDMAGDANGLVSIRALVNAAMNKISLPMGLRFIDSGNDAKTIEYDGVSILDSYVNVSQFKDDDWYTVLEDVLSSIGYTLRYVDSGYVAVAPIRNMPLLGKTIAGMVETQALEFYGGSREYDPAYRSIEEQVDYDYEGDLELPLLSTFTFGANSTYRCAVEGNTLPAGGSASKPEHDAPYNPLSGAGQSCIGTGSEVIDPSRYQPDDFLVRAEGDSWDNYVFLAANGVSAMSQRIAFPAKSTAVTIFLRFVDPLTIRNNKWSNRHYSLYKIEYYVIYNVGSNYKYWDGLAWVDTQGSSTLLKKEYDAQNEYANELEITLDECEGLGADGTITVMLTKIEYKMWSAAGDGVYARLASASVSTNSAALAGNRVNTINNESYNVRSTRKPRVAPLSIDIPFVTPGNYVNALYYYSSGKVRQYGYLASWTGQTATIPIPAMIHEQILCYHFGAAEVLSGNCAPVNKDYPRFDRVYTYKGKRFLLQAATLDMMSGQLVGAAFHEFLQFTDLWDESEQPDWSGNTYYQKDGSGSFSGGGSSSGGGGGSTPTPTPTPTTVNGGTVFYGHITSTKATAAKVATVTGMTAADLKPGATVVLFCDYSNSATGATLNVNSTGAKPMRDMAALDGSGFTYDWSQYETLTFVYDGSSWNLVNKFKAYGSYRGNVKIIGSLALLLAASTYSDDQTISASTAKEIYDLIQGGGGGGVSSVGLTMPTGFSVTGSPVTGSGTLQVSLASGYKMLKTTEWNEAYVMRAPVLEIHRGYRRGEQAPVTPYLIAKHPAIGAINRAEFVLMVRTARKGRRRDTKQSFYRKAWGLAMGQDGEGALTFGSTVTLTALREFILHNYCSGYLTNVSAMTYAQFKQLTVQVGFGHPQGNLDAYVKNIKHTRVFGIAVRYTNPAFAELASGPLSDHTAMIKSNGTVIPRWIYSEVAPILVRCERGALDGTGTNDGGVIGFRLLP